MDTHLTHALSSLQSQLDYLTSQQSALLASYSLTTSSLDAVPSSGPTATPNYHRIAPTLSQISAYMAKLDRLRTQMASQQAEVENLKTRTLEAARRRKDNMERLRARRREEGEKDRTVLRARMAMAPPAGGGDAASEGTAGAVPERTASPAVQSNGSGKSTPTPVMVKRKKKARRVEM